MKMWQRTWVGTGVILAIALTTTVLVFNSARSDPSYSARDRAEMQALVDTVLFGEVFRVAGR